MSRRRRSTMDRALTSVLGLVAWVKRPRWTPGLRTAALVGSVLFATYWTGSLIRGALAVGGLLTAYGIYRVVSWFVTRRRLTLEAGLPVRWWRMVLAFAREREKFALYEKRWEVACAAQSSLKWAGQSPKLKRMQQTLAGDVKALIDPGAIGGDVETVAKLAPVVLPGVMKCVEVSVLPTAKPGTAWITFYNSRPLERAIRLAELPLSGPDLITFGVEESGAAAAVKYGLSTLIIGETGSGKSKAAWNIFADILRDGRPTELYVVNPKNTELSVFKHRVGQRIGNIRIMGYIGNELDKPLSQVEQDTVALCTRFVSEMKARQVRLEDMKQRELTDPTDDFPARYIWVDEMSEIPGAYKSANAPMITAISQGRISLDWVVASDQVAKIENLGAVRDRFPLRIGMRMATPENTKAALTIGEDRGVYCSRIPRDMPGVGYYVREGGEIRRFRTANVTNAELDDLANGILPDGMLTQADMNGERTFTYVIPDKCAPRTCYVGLSDDPPRRFAQHRRNDMGWCSDHERVENWWLIHADVANAKIEPHPSRPAARAAEARLIKDLRPYFNIVHNSDDPLANVNLANRAGAGRRLRDAAGEWREVARDVEAVLWADRRFRKQERVAAEVDKRDRFVAAVTQG